MLRAIGEAGAFDVVLRGELTEPVEQSVTNAPLEDAIRELVGAHFLVVVQGDPDQAEAGLSEIRGSASRAQGSVEVSDGEPDPAEPSLAAEAEAADPIDRQEAYRPAVLDYVPPTKDGLLFELDEPDQAARARGRLLCVRER